jgi:L,D-transpeptidase ErfK/SrfK
MTKKQMRGVREKRDDGRWTMDEETQVGPVIRHSSSFALSTCFPILVIVSMCSVLVFSLSWGGEVSRPVPIETLRSEVQLMQDQAAQLDEENQGLRNMLRDMDDNELYLVVDTESNRLEMRQGNTIVLTAKVGTGSRQFVKEDRGRNWYFESPMGSLTVLGRERNPVWIRPDWSYVEENMPIPPANDPERYVRDVLGKYAILLGNGYKIHGTKWKQLLGTHFTHGCVSLDDDNLEILYKSVKKGTKVYIY